jgi:hypothetical protein
MGSGAKFGHCPEVSFLNWSEAVEPHAEETFIKGGNGMVNL